MKDLFTVASFTIKDMIKRKSFIISNLIILAIIVLLFNVPNILNAIMGDDTSSQNTKILIVDENNIFEGTLEQINQMDIGYDATIVTEAMPFEEIKQKIENNEIDDALVITEKDEQINLQYIVESLAMVSQMPQSLTNAISTILNFSHAPFESLLKVNRVFVQVQKILKISLCVAQMETLCHFLHF